MIQQARSILTQGLVDRFGRTIQYLRLSVTDRCNLRCVYCLPEKGAEWLSREEVLRFEEMAEVVRVAVSLGITKVRLTGGEPLVRSRLSDLIEMLGKIPGLNDLSLTTNAMMLAPQAESLARAGLKRVNISLDTLDPKQFKRITRLGSIEKVFQGIDAAMAYGLDPVKLNVVVMRGVNDDEVIEMARLSLKRPLHVRFIELMPIGEYFTAKRHVPAEEILKRLEGLGPLHSVDTLVGCGPAKIYQLEGAQGTIGIIGAVSQSFCASCNRLRLTATGRLRPCLDDTASTDLKPALRPSCDSAHLARLIRQTVLEKPEQHSMAEREQGTVRFCMAGVGG